MLTATNYVEWQRYSGTCVTQLSDIDFLHHAERELSEEGTTVMLIHKFLFHNKSFQNGNSQMNLHVWRETAADGNIVERTHFIDRTAAALRAIGATTAADILPTIQSESLFGRTMDVVNEGGDMLQFLQDNNDGKPFGVLDYITKMMPPSMASALGLTKPPTHPPIEPIPEIRALLENYVADQQPALQQDIDRYGDPRLAPGFDPVERERELDAEYERRMKALRKQEAAAERLKKREQSPVITKDEQILQRLAAIGEYDVDEDAIVGVTFEGDPVNSPDDCRSEFMEGRLLNWESPIAFEPEWTQPSLGFAVLKDDASLRLVLDAWDRFLARKSEHFETIRMTALKTFREYDKYSDPFFPFAEDYPREEGKVPDAAILASVEEGSIRFTVVVHGSTHLVDIGAGFAVDWEQEHGLEVHLLDEPASARPELLAWTDNGPMIGENDVAEFEREIGVSLSDDYREFLLTINGGRPEPNQFIAVHRYAYPHQVELLFSLPSKDAALDGLLLEMTRKLKAYLRADLVMIPIGRMADGTNIAIGVSDDNKGRVFVLPENATLFRHEPFDKFERRIWMMDDSPVASSFSRFLARLTV